MCLISIMRPAYKFPLRKHFFGEAQTDSMSHGGLSLMFMGMLKVGVPEPDRAHLVCLCLLGRIADKVIMCHKWPGHCVGPLKRLIPEYLRSFRLLYGASSMVHKFWASPIAERTGLSLLSVNSHVSRILFCEL